MRRRFLVGAAVLAMALVVGAWRSEAPASNGRASKGKTVRVDSKQTSINPGATTTITDDYFQDGKMVGGDQISCVLTGPGALAICTAANMLPKGEIISVGSVKIPPPTGNPGRPASTDPNLTTTVAIVGGTGSYVNARGTIDIVPTSTTESTETFYIVG